MLYLYIDDAILKDKCLSFGEKIIYAYLFEKWKQTAFETNQIYEDHGQKYQAFLLAVNKMSMDLYQDRRNLYKILERLQENEYIKFISMGNSTAFYMNIDKELIKNYYETNKIIGELKQKWKKK